MNFNRFDEKYGITLKGRQILDDCRAFGGHTEEIYGNETLEDVGIKHIFLYYDPEKEMLTVYCRYTSDKPTESHMIKKYECNSFNFAVLVTGVVNDPLFITSNPYKVSNVTVEYGIYR